MLPACATLCFMNSRNKKIQHSIHRNAHGIGPASGYEIVIRGMPEGWVVYTGANNLSASGAARRDGADWVYTASDNSELPLRIFNEETKESKQLIAHPPVDAIFSELLPYSDSTPNTQPPASTNGTLAFSSVGGWARDRVLVVALSADNNNNRKLQVGADGSLSTPLSPGQWDISVVGDSRVTPVVIVAGQTASLSLSAPGSTPLVSADRVTINVYGVSEGDRVASTPQATFVAGSTPGSYSASFDASAEGARVHVTLIRRNGQNETRTVAISRGTNVDVRFNAPEKPSSGGTNYFLWGAGGILALGAIYAATAKTE